MDSSPAKAFWDGLTLDQKKEVVAIAAGRQPEDDCRRRTGTTLPLRATLADVLTMTIGEDRGHYVDVVQEEREEQFRRA